VKRSPVAIVGASETTELGRIPGTSAIELHADAARNAVRDCGVAPGEIDGIACAGQSPHNVAHYLGIKPRWLDGTTVGGCSFLIHVRHAVAALRAGQCNVVLITHGQSGYSGVGASRRPSDPASLAGQFEAPYGPGVPPVLFPMGVVRYMHQFGLTHEQLASVAVAQRRWSAQNPRAMMRDLITVDDVLASPIISYPLHRLECCLKTDGGGALVLMTEERFRDSDLQHRPVYVVGAGEASETPMVSQMDDLTTSAAFRSSGRQAFADAGIGHQDVDHLMIYDAFAHLPIYGLEDLGFVGRGEAGAFIASGATSPGGSLPLNTNGGGLSYTHTGMYGMFAIQESVRQVRGTAPAQVDDVRISVAHGVGGMFSTAATLVLGSDPG
jgi:acetyl-CoA acetyltransferase